MREEITTRKNAVKPTMTDYEYSRCVFFSLYRSFVHFIWHGEKSGDRSSCEQLVNDNYIEHI